MPVSAATLRALIASGLQGEALVNVVELIDADTAAAQPKRSTNAERQKRYRERHGENNVTNNVTDVTQQSDAAPETRKVSPTPPSKETQTLKENPPMGGQKKRGTRIPDGIALDLSAAEAEGLSRMQAEREGRKFVDYWRGVAGANGIKLDWPATWRNWCRRAAEQLGVEGRAEVDGTMVSKADPRWQFLTTRWERENDTPFPKLADKWPFPAAWLIDANKPEWPDAPAFLVRQA